MRRRSRNDRTGKAECDSCGGNGHERAFQQQPFL
jgi:hypothetical protein